MTINWVRFHNYKVYDSGMVTDLEDNLVFVHQRPDGYRGVLLTYEGRRHYHLIHRLVAEMFLPNPYNLPQVHHKDNRKGNNHVDNLCWCSRSENMVHSAIDRGLCREIIRELPDGTLDIYRSMREAYKLTGVSRITILKCINNKRKDQHGNSWRYVYDEKSDN